MTKIILICTVFLFAGCLKKDEEVVETFYRNLVVEKKFDEAFDLISNNAKSKMEPTSEENTTYLKDMLTINKYNSLYDYQAKRFQFKIESIEEMGKEAKIVNVEYRIVNFDNDIIKYYEKESLKLKAEDAEIIFDDKFIARHTSNLKRSKNAFFQNIKEKVLIVRENGKWVVDVNKTSFFLQEYKPLNDLFRHSYFDVTDMQANKEKIADMKKLTVKEYLKKIAIGHISLVTPILDCAEKKAGNVKAYDYEIKQKQKMADLFEECRIQISNESLGM